MSACSVNFSALRRREHAIALLIAEYIQNREEWYITGDIPLGLQLVLTKAQVRWHHCEAAPISAHDMTSAIIRITEVERGLARYIFESEFGTISIAYQNHRYRVLIGHEPYGSFSTPREAVAAIHQPEAQALLVEGTHTLAECDVPRDFGNWVLARLPERPTVVSGMPAGSDGLPGLALAAQLAAAE